MNIFFSAGRIESEGNYKDDLKEGEWKSYLDNGENYSWNDNRFSTISRIENYSKGEKSGKYILYHHTNKVYIF